jgi:hypothetical protein
MAENLNEKIQLKLGSSRGKFPKRRTRLKGGGEKPIINSPVTGENKRRGEDSL